MNLQNLQAEIAEAIFMNDQHNELIYPANNLSIYQDNMQATLARALKNSYPMIVKIIGDDFFLLTAKEYIASYPSLSGDLNEYGAYFSDFVASYQALVHLPYLAEVAKFEWTCHRLAYMAEANPFDIKLLEKIASDHYSRLNFILNPACDIYAFRYPILRIIALCKNEITGPIDMDEGGVNLLIYRRHHDLSLVALKPGEYLFLTSLTENKPLSHALDLALAADPMFKLDEMLPLWIKNRIIIDCNLLS